MNPPGGSKTAQGYELQLGVNNIGTFLFTKLLAPTLISTAKSDGPGSVRVVWVSSSAAEAPYVPPGGVDMCDLHNRSKLSNWACYSLSKAGTILHALEFAQLHKEYGIISVPLNPGNVNTELWRTQGRVAIIVLRVLFLHRPKYGAYSELFAGLSPEVTKDKSGEWGKLNHRRIV